MVEAEQKVMKSSLRACLPVRQGGTTKQSTILNQLLQIASFAEKAKSQ
jgi:hypothetical protein